MASVRVLGATCVVALVVSACGGDDERSWSHLAAGFHPAPLPDGSLVWERSADGQGPWRLVPEPGSADVWIESDVAADAWSPTGWAGVFATRRGSVVPGVTEFRLSVDGRTLEQLETRLGRPDPAAVPPGTFAVVGDLVLVALGKDAAAPRAARLAWRATRGRERDGRFWTEVTPYSGDGWPVWSGTTASRRLDVPAGSALRFTLATRPLGKPAAGATLTLRVELDGAELTTLEVPLTARSACAPHALVLPPEGADGAELTVAVDGPPALAALLAPTIGPADVGRYDARPWGDDRPDLVLFLADTFRADNLTAYGGTHGLTPELDRLCDESLVFERAWAPSPWTLPSQASMFTGLEPHQHGATHFTRSLHTDLVTIAEVLRDAGYRTGAVTEAGYVTPTYGLDQGFEFFRAVRTTDDDLLDVVESFLAADDGRPAFLFVQTYRTHVPYLPSEQVKREHGERLTLDADFFAVRDALEEGVPNQGPADPEPPHVAEHLPVFRDMYLGTVADLDRLFGRFRSSLDASGVLPGATLVFTSDHGEAFYEHRTIGHGNGVWEEHLRVPLVVHGPGVAAGSSGLPALLIDLPHTLSARAGLLPEERWNGADLLVLREDRHVHAFECNNRGDASSMALVVDGFKLIVPESRDAWDERVEHAYDLVEDPAEAHDLAASEPPADPRVRRLPAAGSIERLFQPIVDPASVQLSEGARADLAALGYLDGEDDE